MATLQWFGSARGRRPSRPQRWSARRRLRLRPAAVAHAYLELVCVRAAGGRPGSSGIDGVGEGGTGRAVGAAIGAAGAFVKTHGAVRPRRPADGYTVVAPADRPRLSCPFRRMSHGRHTARIAETC